MTRTEPAASALTQALDRVQSLHPRVIDLSLGRIERLPMLSIAGLGVAFHAKPLVKENARHAISTLGLDGILYLLGVRDREARE